MTDHACDFGGCTNHAPTTVTVDYGDCIVHVDRCHEHLCLTQNNHEVLDVRHWE